MKFHYAGKYTDETKLPEREHPEGFVQFKEPDNIKKFSLIANIAAFFIMIACFVGVYFRLQQADYTIGYSFAIGAILAMVVMVPHEFLHALCFKSDVYMYNGLSKGVLFVIGLEDMSRLRFVMMSLCPNIVFGFLPYILFMIFPNLVLLGSLGAISIGAGAGDYINVFNCLTQVPRGAKVYMSGMRSYWYKPISSIE